MLETLGIIITLLAVAGVFLNNYRMRACFIVWLISNTLSVYVHYVLWRDGGECVALIIRDLIFLALAIHGWWSWGRSKNEN